MSCLDFLDGLLTIPLFLFWSRRLARVFDQTLEASDTVPSLETAFLPPVACINAQMDSTRHAVIRALMRSVSSFSCSADHAAGTSDFLEPLFRNLRGSIGGSRGGGSSDSISSCSGGAAP